MKTSRYPSLMAIAATCTGMLMACGAEPAFTGSTFAPLDEAKGNTVETSGERMAPAGDDATDRGPTRNEGPEVDPRKRKKPQPKVVARPVEKDSEPKVDPTEPEGPEEPQEPQEPKPTPPPVEPAELCSSAAVQTRTVSLVFEERRSSCPWSMGDNLSARDSSVRSRIEDVRSLGLESGSTLCGLSISSKVQDIQFDDEMILTFNDRILMASYDYTYLFNQSDGHFQYSWSQLTGAFNPGPSTPWKPYCLGGITDGTESSCKVPKTQTVGSFELKVPLEDSFKLSAVAKEQGKAQIGLIVTGDNDDGDCSHSEISLEVEMRYVEGR